MSFPSLPVVKREDPICGVLDIVVIEAKGFSQVKHGLNHQKPDPFVRLSFGNSGSLSTNFKTNTRDPVWNKEFRIWVHNCTELRGAVHFVVYDHHRSWSDKRIGECLVMPPLDENAITQWVAVHPPGMPNESPVCHLRLKMAFFGRPSSWRVTELPIFLEAHDDSLRRWVPVLRTGEIDGKAMLTVTEEDLKALHIPIGPCRNIVRLIGVLRKREEDPGLYESVAEQVSQAAIPRWLPALARDDDLGDVMGSTDGGTPKAGGQPVFIAGRFHEKNYGTSRSMSISSQHVYDPYSSSGMTESPKASPSIGAHTIHEAPVFGPLVNGSVPSISQPYKFSPASTSLPVFPPHPPIPPHMAPPHGARIGLGIQHHQDGPTTLSAPAATHHHPRPASAHPHPHGRSLSTPSPSLTTAALHMHNAADNLEISSDDESACGDDEEGGKKRRRRTGSSHSSFSDSEERPSERSPVHLPVRAATASILPGYGVSGAVHIPIRVPEIHTFTETGNQLPELDTTPALSSSPLRRPLSEMPFEGGSSAGSDQACDRSMSDPTGGAVPTPDSTPHSGESGPGTLRDRADVTSSALPASAPAAGVVGANNGAELSAECVEATRQPPIDASAPKPLPIIRLTDSMVLSNNGSPKVFDSPFGHNADTGCVPFSSDWLNDSWQAPAGIMGHSISSVGATIGSNSGASVTVSSGGDAAEANPPWYAAPTMSRRQSTATGEEEQSEEWASSFGDPDRLKRRRWKKGHIIGEGATGRVRLGQDLDSGVLMAVKEINVSRDAHLVTVLNEVNLLASLQHPNIVKYLGAERETKDGRSSLYIFLEYVPHGSLATLVQKLGSLTEGVTRTYTHQILLGLEYLHAQNIVHRDIKGGNVLLDICDGKQTCKISDFGASKCLGEIRDFSTVIGTPNFMSPEVIRQQGASFKSDIWSVGCMVIEMLTGAPPFADLQPVQVMWRVGSMHGVPEELITPLEICEDGRSFLRLCLAPSAEGRPSATDLLAHAWFAPLNAPLE